MSRKNSFLAARALISRPPARPSPPIRWARPANVEAAGALCRRGIYRGVIAQIKQLLSLLPSVSAEDPMLFEIRMTSTAPRPLDAASPADVLELYPGSGGQRFLPGEPELSPRAL